MAALVASLTLCLASLWCPGSPFDPALVTTTLNTTSTGGRCDDPATRPDMTSVSVLLAGIIGARLGLWVADLAVTQILQVGIKAVNEPSRSFAVPG